MKEKNEYVQAQIHIVSLSPQDVIATSILSNDNELTYDSGAWT